MASLRVFLATLLAVAISACGGGDSGDSTPAPPAPPPTVITISLATATPAIQVNQAAQFQATLAGTTNLQVSYSVEGGSANGSISASGLYTAPDHAGVFTVRATSAADPTKSATAAIAVTAAPVVTMTMTPANATVTSGGSVAFSTNEPATFAVAGGSANGTVTATGPGNASYIAPATPGVYQVVATATADAARKATATVTVSAGGGFRISSNMRIAPGSMTQFSAFLNDQPTAATWSIVGACQGCSINSAGLFAAGNAVESVTVKGANPTNATQVATAIVTIASEVILTLNAPQGASLTWADMLTFSAFISPQGIENGVAWTTSPAGSGSIFNVDYFFGWLPPPTPGAYTLTGASVADPTKTGSFAAQVTAPPATALVAAAGVPASMRYQHAAAAMPDGRIVVVGGLQDRQSFIPVRTSEVFDAIPRTFSNGPSLAVDRVQPEAVSIDANRVLVTGGREEYNLSRNTAEVLNLSSGVASATANSMAARRIHHQMVRLGSGPNSGKVLVMGGFNGPVPYGEPTWLATSSVDLFDPASNTFTPSGVALKTARGLFSATALADGRILIVGGYEPAPGAGTLASAEIYDPVAGTFTFTGSMSTARDGHTATRLPDGKVLIVGGDQSATTQSSAELYDPASGTFSTLGSRLAVTRIHHSAASLADGRVMIFGGESGNFLVRGTVEAYDPATQSFSLFGRMATPRARGTATALTAGPAAGKIMVFGGGARNTPATAAEVTP
ncbi:MAG: kelch repeat-containing protein [Ramlibacter sp.]